MYIDKPIFILIKEALEDDIIAGKFKAGELLISTTSIARLYGVNPATAVKSVGLLTAEGITFKKRGIGMCITQNAKNIIIARRKRELLTTVIGEVVSEATKLGISPAELTESIGTHFEEQKGDRT
ncbi:MAG: GntR family transcriptional regulator [Christensenellales bacterium]